MAGPGTAREAVRTQGFVGIFSSIDDDVTGVNAIETTGSGEYLYALSGETDASQMAHRTCQ